MNTKRRKRQEYAGSLALLLATIVWGWGFVFSNMALEAGFSPAAVVFLRFALATIFVGGCFHKTIRTNYQRGQWKGGFITGFFLFLGFFTQTLGLELSTPSNNAFITGSYVVMVPLFGWAIFKRPPPPVILISSCLSLAGVAILSIKTTGGGLTVNPGDLFTLLCAVFFALQIIANGVFAASMHYITLVFIQFVTATVLALPCFLIMDRNIAPLFVPSGALSVVFLALFSTVFCYFLQTKAQGYVPASKAGIILGMESLFGTLFSMLIGYDQPSLKMLAGGALMLASIILPEIFRDKSLPAPSEP